MTVPPIPPPGWAERRPAPAPPHPGDRTGLALGVAQTVAALLAAAGVYLLAGLAWALVIVGGVAFVLACLIDYARSRPAPPAPAPGGDR